MSVTAATTTPPVTPPASQAQTAQDKLSSNFSTFLTLLTTQLQNQDPLSPMDSNQFTQKLVQFSQVEQQIDSNKNLESLISLTKTQGATNAVSYLGKTITLTDGTAALEGSAGVKWAYSLPSTAAKARLIVTDSKGHAVFSGPAETASGLHAFSWDGKTTAGNDAPAGTYKLTVSAQAADDSAITSSVASQGIVSEVDLTGTEPMLMIGPLGVPLSKATLISGQ
jgi:flagellar basal-body rod modification protein FlgD